METADVVVVGAGANGTSTAYHLAKSGVQNVTVVERGHLAAGATGKSGALVRMHYTNEPETRLAVESFKYFESWSEVVGGDCGLQPVGLFVFTPPEHYADLEANVAMQREIDPSVCLGGRSHAQCRLAADHRGADGVRWALLHDRRQRHLVQDQSGDRPLPQRAGHDRAEHNGRPDAVPGQPVRRGRALDRRAQLRRRRAGDHLALAGTQ
jgi:glycine/D-amino acid oxidase-like deaminating enzyme